MWDYLASFGTIFGYIELICLSSIDLLNITNLVFKIQIIIVSFWRLDCCTRTMKQMPRVPQITHWNNDRFLLNHTLYLILTSYDQSAESCVFVVPVMFPVNWPYLCLQQNLCDTRNLRRSRFECKWNLSYET